MARKPSKPRRPRKADIKAAADRAEKRAKGEPVDTPVVAIDPGIVPAAAIVKAKAAAKRKGRPTRYSKPLAKAICKMLASGLSVRAIGRRPRMPAATTILSWGNNPDHPFSEQYARSREIGLLLKAEEIVDISDDGSNDWMEREAKDGTKLGWQVNGEAVARSRLRIDTRKWMLSKMLPKLYGEKTTFEHTGKDGGPISISDETDKMALARWIAYHLTADTADDGEAVH